MKTKTKGNLITVHGDILSKSQDAFTEVVAKTIENNPKQDIIFDLRDCTRMDSSILGTILAAKKSISHFIIFKNTPENIANLVRITGLTQVIKVERPAE